MKWVWTVRYRKDGKMKDRYFAGDEAAAKAFYDHRRKYLEGALLLRSRPESWWERLAQAEIRWRGRSAKALEVAGLAAALAALLIVWRLYP